MPFYPCLVLDHDDTVVSSTREIHYPAFLEVLAHLRPQARMGFEEYMLANFSPGFVPLCRELLLFDDEEMRYEVESWRAYVKNHIPHAFPGMRELMERQKAAGGRICVASHSMRENILRDYRANGLPEPDAIFGWDMPPECRKPYPYPLLEIMRRYGLSPSELLMVDDLKPGCDMARGCGVAVAGAGWAYSIPAIESGMREMCGRYFTSVAALSDYLFGR